MKNTLGLNFVATNRNRNTDSLQQPTLGQSSLSPLYGIPRSNPSPFKSRDNNFRRNSERYLQATSILREVLNQVLYINNAHYNIGLARIFADMDIMFNYSQKDFCVYLSSLHNWFKLYILSGRKDMATVQAAWWDSHNNCPISLARLIVLLENESNNELKLLVVRLTLSILSIHKVLSVPTEVSLESVTGKFTGEDEHGYKIDWKDVFNMMNINIESLRYQFFQTAKRTTIAESNSAGPNGHAVWSSHMDAYEVTRDPKLSDSIRDLSERLGIHCVPERLDSVVDIFSFVDLKDLNYSGALHSKIHLLYEKGIKTRLIAIIDLFSQTVLQPFADVMYTILLSLENDCTDNQERGFEKVKFLTQNHLDVYSLDLSKATDRLPLLAQRNMLAALIGDEKIADLWSKVIGDREFFTETGHKVKYAVGQPMGSKSSFQSMALFHHGVVLTAAKLAGRDSYKDYVILGDDLVLVGTDVKDQYIMLMNSLGMNISWEKSVQPFNDNKNTGAEFCSRLALNGIEVTGLPMHSIVESISNSENISNLWDIVRTRGIFHGQDIWKFFSIFLTEKDLQYLILLNSLPKEVTGINNPLIPTGSKCMDEDEQRILGISMKDITNFYYYVQITDCLSKVDMIAKRTSNMLSIFDLEVRTRPDGMSSYVSGLPLSLSMIINSQLSDKPGFEDKYSHLQHTHNKARFVHPIQDVVLSVGNKILSILNMFNGSTVDIPSLLKMKEISILDFSLDKKAKYMSTSSNTVLGNRRVLEKALRLLIATTKKEGSKNVSYIGKLDGITHLWSVNVTVGKKLIITPHVKRLNSINQGSETRLSSSIKKTTLLGSIQF